MLDTSYTGQLLSGVFYLIVGLGLLRLAHRTGELPERLLGLYFLFTGLDYSLYSIPSAFGIESIQSPAAATALLSYAMAVMALLLFTRRVFRTSERWASWLAHSARARLNSRRPSSPTCSRGLLRLPTSTIST